MQQALVHHAQYYRIYSNVSGVGITGDPGASAPVEFLACKTVWYELFPCAHYRWQCARAPSTCAAGLAHVGMCVLAGR